MSCVALRIATLNAAGLPYGFAALYLSATHKSWIIALPTIFVVAPLTRRLVARLTRDEPNKMGHLHRQWIGPVE